MDMKDENLSVLIAVSHRLLGDGLVANLNQANEFESVALVDDVDALLESMNECPVDIILCDVEFYGEALDELLEKLFEITPETCVLLYGDLLEQKDISSFFTRGVCGIISKSASPEEIKCSLLNSVVGGTSISSNVFENFISDRVREDVQQKIHHLSAREAEILDYTTRGLSNKVIADILNISIRTVESHRQNIRKKTGSANLIGLINFAMNQN